MSVSDSDDSGSLNSMLHVRAAELYPKKILVETHESASTPIPFSPLCGEAVEFVGRITDGVLALSNYRLYYQRTGREGKGDFNIPLGLVEMVEVKELFHLTISCKDVRTYRCSFPTNNICMDWTRRINKALLPPRNIDEIFAFAYFAWAHEEGGEEIVSCLGRDQTNIKDYFKSEYERMRFESDSRYWRISYANNDYKLCPSYPKQLIVPARFSDQALMSCAKFRSSQRIPAVVWRHKENGMILARSSQPEVGWFCWRSNDDEELLKLLCDCCVGKNQYKSRLLVLDARSYTAAVANRARGGGCECLEYYSNIDIQFMNLANIHYIRKSFQSLRQLCALPPDSTNWHSSLENTKWLSHMSLLFHAAVRAAVALEKDAQPVLVHCSDGWDRTTQIVSLTELLLDPYYRTIEGFQMLCEREWLDFGHKFADRCGIGEDVNEKCPVFLQWLDCVHNLMEQFPCAFEFSKRYLIKLAEHCYSNLFGTFLCNSSAERQRLGIAQRTYSVWRYLNSPHFRNYLYDKNSERILWPKFAARDLQIWRDLYIDFAYDNQCFDDQISVNGNSVINVNTDPNNVSHDIENGNLNNLGNNLGSMLESAINCQPENGSDSGTGTNDEIENKFGSVMRNDDEGEEVMGLQIGVIGSEFDELALTGDEICHSTLSSSAACLNLIEFDNTDDKIQARKEEIVAQSTISLENSSSRCLTNCSNIEDGEEIENDEATVKEIELRERLQQNEARCCVDFDMNLNDSCNSTNRNSDDYNKNDSCEKDDLVIENKDCDILSNDSKNTEDCDNSMIITSVIDENSELINRLNAGDASVESSVETVVDSRCLRTSNSLNDLFEYKTVSNGLRNYELSSCSNGRQQLSLLLDPIDGLPLIPDDVQDRMQQISIEHKAKLAAVSNELQKTRFTLMNKICNQCTHLNLNSSLPDRPLIYEDDKGSVCSTEISWEAVDDKDVGGQVLWVPDHAVSHCTTCDCRFWLGRRKHHCRGCGKIFCADCSRNVTSLPNEQLFDPVRVCEECYHTKGCASYNNSPKQTTCKQAAAGEEKRNSNIMLPPAPPPI